MRRIAVSRSIFVVAFSLGVFVTVRVAHSAPQTKTKSAPPVAAAVVSYGNADSITEEEMKIYDYFLASDQLEGRNLPSRGFDVAALYIASHLAEWGLKPGGSTTKTDGPLQPYFIPMALASRQIVPEESKASLIAPAVAGGGGRGAGGFGGGAAAAAPAEGAVPASGGGGRGRGGRGGGRGGSGGGRAAAAAGG